MHFLGNYFGVEPAYYGPETQEQYEKRMREESYGPGLPPGIKDSTYEKEWKKREREQAEAERARAEQWGRATGRGVTTAINIYGQAEAGRPVLPSGRTGPRVTAGGGTYGPGYSDPGTPGTQAADSFVSHNKWLLVGAGGGALVLLFTTILLLKRKKKEF